MVRLSPQRRRKIQLRTPPSHQIGNRQHSTPPLRNEKQPQQHHHPRQPINHPIHLCQLLHHEETTLKPRRIARPTGRTLQIHSRWRHQRRNPLL